MVTQNAGGFWDLPNQFRGASKTWQEKLMRLQDLYSEKVARVFDLSVDEAKRGELLADLLLEPDFILILSTAVTCINRLHYPLSAQIDDTRHTTFLRKYLMSSLLDLLEDNGICDKTKEGIRTMLEEFPLVYENFDFASDFYKRVQKIEKESDYTGFARAAAAAPHKDLADALFPEIESYFETHGQFNDDDMLRSAGALSKRQAHIAEKVFEMLCATTQKKRCDPDTVYNCVLMFMYIGSAQGKLSGACINALLLLTDRNFDDQVRFGIVYALEEISKKQPVHRHHVKDRLRIYLKKCGPVLEGRVREVLQELNNLCAVSSLPAAEPS